MSNLVTVTIDSGVATIAMDDGKANVLSHAMWDELEAAFDQAEEAKAIVVLKGRAGIFSGGFDLKEMSKGVENCAYLDVAGLKNGSPNSVFPNPSDCCIYRPLYCHGCLFDAGLRLQNWRGW